MPRALSFRPDGRQNRTHFSGLCKTHEPPFPEPPPTAVESLPVPATPALSKRASRNGLFTAPSPQVLPHWNAEIRSRFPYGEGAEGPQLLEWNGRAPLTRSHL